MFEIYKDDENAMRWRLKMPNGRIVAVSPEPFAKRSAVLGDIRRVKEMAPGAQIVEVL